MTTGEVGGEVHSGVVEREVTWGVARSEASGLSFTQHWSTPTEAVRSFLKIQMSPPPVKGQ